MVDRKRMLVLGFLILFAFFAIRAFTSEQPVAPDEQGAGVGMKIKVVYIDGSSRVHDGKKTIWDILQILDPNAPDPNLPIDYIDLTVTGVVSWVGVADQEGMTAHGATQLTIGGEAVEDSTGAIIDYPYSIPLSVQSQTNNVNNYNGVPFTVQTITIQDTDIEKYYINGSPLPDGTHTLQFESTFGVTVYFEDGSDSAASVVTGPNTPTSRFAYLTFEKQSWGITSIDVSIGAESVQ